MGLKPCLERGCPRLSTGSRCLEHTRAHQAARDAVRNMNPMRQLYRSAAWRKLSEQARAEQPWCSAPTCRSDDLTTDHIVSPLDGGAALDPANVQVLCRAHQNRKRDREGRRVL